MPSARTMEPGAPPPPQTEKRASRRCNAGDMQAAYARCWTYPGLMPGLQTGHCGAGTTNIPHVF